MTEITEEDVLEKKLEALHQKLENDYNKGFDAQKDPEKLINLKSIRMPFLNIGPQIQNLEFFENLESLYLNNNCI